MEEEEEEEEEGMATKKEREREGVMDGIDGRMKMDKWMENGRKVSNWLLVDKIRVETFYRTVKGIYF